MFYRTLWEKTQQFSLEYFAHILVNNVWNKTQVLVKTKHGHRKNDYMFTCESVFKFQGEILMMSVKIQLILVLFYFSINFKVLVDQCS